MNDHTNLPKTRTITDASGMSVTISEPSEESRKAIKRVLEKHKDALIRLADR